VNSISSSDRWSNGKNKSRTRIGLKVLHRLQTKELARMAGISRICNQQQNTFNNQSVSIHGKLQQRVENMNRFKKERKDRKSNRVCGEDEKDIRESSEKSIGRDEEASR